MNILFVFMLILKVQCSQSTMLYAHEVYYAKNMKKNITQYVNAYKYYVK